jgi:hypothetical protein
MRSIIICLLGFCSLWTRTQSVIQKPWCGSSCNAAGDEIKNTKLVYMRRSAFTPVNRSANVANSLTPKTETSDKGKVLVFPLRIGIIDETKSVSETSIKKTVDILNTGFKAANIQFKISKIDFIPSDLKLEDMYENNYELYRQFSASHDKKDEITVYLFTHRNDLCTVTPTSISCGRTGGFSYILSELTNNIVLSVLDLQDDKVIVHEMAHFFGLYHTFEEEIFGKDNFVDDCNVAGDCLCDTPPDPGSVFEVYVNYSLCEMKGYKHDNGNIYKPLINNYMAYYKPCYMKTYSFTTGQSEILRLAALSELRSKFMR